MSNIQWINREEYPFKSKFIELDMGKMHYIDEGEGAPIVMVHGNPTWSFLYRHMIKGLSKKYRCIAMDHIGFGLSDKPYDWSYFPEEHAKNLNRLIEKLGLEDITLVVQDWGGPIGLSYAIGMPNKVKNLIIMNTWMWSVNDDPHFRKFSKLMGGAFGRFMIKRYNFFVRVVMKKATADKSKLSKPIHSHYLSPLKNSRDRKGCWVFPKQIIDSSSWLDSLWSQKEKIKNKPALILWGMKDIAFREQELKKWKDLFSYSQAIEFDDVGHFVQEEKGSELYPIIEDFLSTNTT
ncbi:MAG: 2-hydroxy-6-oxo-7-methylocta-2,4-dienoate hydrolase [Candidatus Scalindua rubra]|uniref:2-hydroxy-6-oxo-7-methylocta-2,4-dienoate hydrolase n=1 Tax=Candidatus Scalindua rubra TaxID=1872076 RepID=A0A1E3X556_9BACT|nr:MAG: 2-hydroxy-6-oxo-7-methylocta-2,4-dienoate hydrolase [Candidatus Scalindua rubra]